MGDSQKMVECVVVFDQLGLATGEYVPQGPGMQPLAVTTVAFRGEKVMLTQADADRHLDSGAVILASDKRVKLVQPNAARTGGVIRDTAISLSGTVQLEETEPATAGDSGATRAKGGTLGTKKELEQKTVTELKHLAAEHGVEVERGDTKPKLAAKLAKVKLAEPSEEVVNPGQEPDESPPPDTQPETAPEDAPTE